MDHAEKVALLTAGRDLSRARGLEIGARDAPLLRREDGPILYADHATTEQLRANLPPSIDPALLVEVDVVSGQTGLPRAMPHCVDYIVASHVAEHVPDILGWFGELHDILQGDGTVGLAIPDRRYTFDIFRRESSIAEAVEAYLLGLRRPSLRQVFDSCWLAVDVTVPDAWGRRLPDPATPLARLRPALDLVRGLHDAPRYNDAHCWVFTPGSFVDFFDHAARLGLFNFIVETFEPTEQDGYEFYVVLRRTTPNDPAIAGSLAAARERLRTGPAEPTYVAPDIRARMADLQAEVALLEERNDGLLEQIAALRDSLQVMRQSRFWRMTLPVRRVVDRTRKVGGASRSPKPPASV